MNTISFPNKLLELYFSDYMEDKNPRFIRVGDSVKYLTFREGNEDFVISCSPSYQKATPFALTAVYGSGAHTVKMFSDLHSLYKILHSSLRPTIQCSSAQVYAFAVRYLNGEIICPHQASYKGYNFTPHFEEETKTWWGQVDGTKDLITFEADSYSLLEKEFKFAVNDYLLFCKCKSITPDKPEV